MGRWSVNSSGSRAEEFEAETVHNCSLESDTGSELESVHNCSLESDTGSELESVHNCSLESETGSEFESEYEYGNSYDNMAALAGDSCKSMRQVQVNRFQYVLEVIKLAAKHDDETPVDWANKSATEEDEEQEASDIIWNKKNIEEAIKICETTSPSVSFAEPKKQEELINQAKAAKTYILSSKRRKRGYEELTKPDFVNYADESGSECGFLEGKQRLPPSPTPTILSTEERVPFKEFEAVQCPLLSNTLLETKLRPMQNNFDISRLRVSTTPFPGHGVIYAPIFSSFANLE